VQTAIAIAFIPTNLRLDYCNSLLAGAAAHSIAQLQRAQNNAAKVVYFSNTAIPTQNDCFKATILAASVTIFH